MDAIGRLLAGTCGNRTHPAPLSRHRNGFEVREGHQNPIHSHSIRVQSLPATRLLSMSRRAAVHCLQTVWGGLL